MARDHPGIGAAAAAVIGRPQVDFAGARRRFRLREIVRPAEVDDRTQDRSAQRTNLFCLVPAVQWRPGVQQIARTKFGDDIACRHEIDEIGLRARNARQNFGVACRNRLG